MWRWAKKILLMLAVLMGLVIIVAWVWGGVLANRIYVPEVREFSATDQTVSAEEGIRLARAVGCLSCHGENGSGEILFETPVLDRLAASNLTHTFAELSDAELEAIIRQGVGPDGRSYVFMPSNMFDAMSDADLSAIIRGIRSMAPAGEELPETRVGLMIRTFLVAGEFDPDSPLSGMIADHIDSVPMARPPSSDPLATGQYLAQIACTECHGSDLQGDGLDTPSLSMVKAYDLATFRGLMREGLALGDRELELMSDMGRERFKYFTDAEIEALHTYLQTL
jgi:mono/diheme cytochrome c family protein